jgi:hypothetical protein
VAISNRTATTANTGAAAAASLAVNKPTSTAVGDVLITTISVNNGSSCTITTLAGWTLIARTNNTTVLGQGVYYRVADGTEGASFTWSFTSEFASIVCNAYTGVDNLNPIAGSTSLGKTTASTSATFGTTTQKAEVTYAVLCVTGRNTTATTTITASSGYTVDGDTCTTATTFIEAAQQDQHTTFGLPLAAFTPGSATFSTTSTDVDTVIFLRPTLNFSSGNFAPDFATVNENVAANGTLSFTGVTTGYQNEVFYLVIAGDAGATSSVTVTSTGGLTWTKSTSNVTVHGSVYVFTATALSPITNQTITTTDSVDTTTDWGGVLYSFVGANAGAPIGATKTGLVSSSLALSDTVTTTGSNSWVWAVCDDYNLSEAHTLGANQTLVATESDAGAGNTYFIWRQTAVTPAPATSVTMNVTTADFYAYDLFELLALPPIGKWVATAQSVNRLGTY